MTKNCFPKVQKKARTPELITHAAMSSVEPPDMSILRDRSQLDFYIPAHAYNQAPELCKEMSDHFDNSVERNNKGAEKTVTWPKAKFGMNKHANMVKVLNLFLNTTRSKSEDLEWYIARFERNYAEVKKLGESLSPTCLSVLLLRQAQLTDTDNQIITMNLEFDPKANNADQNFENCKASMRKFQYNKTASHQVIGNQPEQSATSIFSASLDNNDDLNQEQVESIKTSLGNTAARGGRGGRRRGGAKRGHAGGDLTEPNKKRKAEQDQDRNDECRQEIPKQATTERDFLTLIQEPEDQTAQEEIEQETLTLITTKVTEIEAELQPLNKLFQVLEIGENRDRGINKEMIYVEDNTTRHGQHTKGVGKYEQKLTMLVDCGSPSTIVGVENFRQIKKQYTAMVQSSFEYSQSNKHYEFGGGRKTHTHNTTSCSFTTLPAVLHCRPLTLILSL